MTLQEFKEKYRDVIITITVAEIARAGVESLVNSDRIISNAVGEEVKACATDLMETYNLSYNDFRSVIKRCL